MALLMMCAVAVLMGPVDLSAGAVMAALMGEDATSDVDTRVSQIVWSIRLPRLCLGLLVGCALASSGAALQGLFRNPLADPYVLGIASGGAFGAALAFWLNDQSSSVLVPPPIAAFGGALLAGMTVFALSRKGGRLTLASLLLSGVAVGMLFSALLALILVLASEQAGHILNWLLGYLGNGSWHEVRWVFVTTAVGFIPLFWVRFSLDGMLLGEDGAASTGIDVQRTQYVVLAASSILVAGAVAFAGLIGFIGLIVPHLVRLLVGPQHRVLLPMSALVGALVLVGADVLARILVDDRELPVGVITGCLGGPFFLILLRRSLNHA
ncbi:MAG: iron ABC transporter permease [Myxococcota bacterium]|nr:iron ABC transporter permease [Myxococcota bacterium]